MTKLSEKIKNLPKSPGVYHFLDENGAVLYVGKAKNLSNRIKQYFLKDLGRGPGIICMVQAAADIRWIETESEIEAVILEAEIIKKLKPKYNIRLKDDKSFFVIKITKKNKQFANESICRFPSVELVRYKNVDLTDKGADYFGPYPSGDSLKRSMNFLRKIFPYRDCSKTKWNTYRRKGRPCIYGDIRVCSAPCNGWMDESQYKKNILYLKNFLRGRKKEVIDSLQREMKALSKDHRYEEAALLRNRLSALDHMKDVAVGLRDDIFLPEKIIFKRIECYDISNIGEKYAVGSMVVFTDGKPDKDEYRKFKIRDSESKILQTEINNDLGRLQQVLKRRFARKDWAMPDLVVIDGGEMQLKVSVESMKKYDIKIPAISISKGAARDKNDFHYSNSDVAKYFAGNTVLKNIAIASRDEAHRFAIEYYRTLHRKDMLK